MTNNKSPQKNENTQNSMELLNGTVLKCYPKATIQESLINDRLSLDSTGNFLRLAGRPSTKNEKDDKTSFLDHAFLFLRSADTILKDSRMFLAPVPVHSGLAYTAVKHTECVGKEKPGV